MTPSSSMHLDCNSFLAWQQIHFGDNPAGSKGFSRHPYHALQGKCNKGRSTRCGHLLPATCYIPHSPASSHSLVTLHSHISSHSSVRLNSPHTCRKLHRSANCPCNLLDLVVCTCYSSDSLQRQYTNSFFTVSNRVSSSGISLCTDIAHKKKTGLPIIWILTLPLRNLILPYKHNTREYAAHQGKRELVSMVSVW